MPLPALDLQRADYGATPLTWPCAWCTRSLDTAWFEVEHQRICAPCAEQARSLFPVDTRERFTRSVALGALAAGIGGLAYFHLFRLTGGSWMIFAAIGLGYLVGRAMRIGSNNLGGRRYQVMAAVLTYSAVALGTTLALIGTKDVPAWAYPIFVFGPFLQLLFGQFSLAALQLMFAFVGIRWAWGIMAGVPWKITGPHNPETKQP